MPRRRPHNPRCLKGFPGACGAGSDQKLVAFRGSPPSVQGLVTSLWGVSGPRLRPRRDCETSARNEGASRDIHPRSPLLAVLENRPRSADFGGSQSALAGPRRSLYGRRHCAAGSGRDDLEPALGVSALAERKRGIEIAIFAFSAVVAVSLIAGYRSILGDARVVGAAHVAAQPESLVLSGADTYIRLVMFWCLSPAPRGEILSRQPPSARDSAPRERVLLAATVALVTQLIFVYVFAGLCKWYDRPGTSGWACFSRSSASSM